VLGAPASDRRTLAIAQLFEGIVGHIAPPTLQVLLLRRHPARFVSRTTRALSSQSSASLPAGPERSYSNDLRFQPLPRMPKQAED